MTVRRALGRGERGHIWVIGIAAMVVVAGCGGTNVATGSGSATAGGSAVNAPTPGSLSDAKAEAKRLVDDTVTAVFTGRQGQQSGTGQRACDPPEAGLVSFEYGMTVSVSPSDVDQLAVDAWNHFKQLGVRPDGSYGNDPKVGGPNAPAPSGKLNGYRVAITGNRENAVVHVDVTTPCLKPDGG